MVSSFYQHRSVSSSLSIFLCYQLTRINGSFEPRRVPLLFVQRAIFPCAPHLLFLRCTLQFSLPHLLPLRCALPFSALHICFVCTERLLPLLLVPSSSMPLAFFLRAVFIPTLLLVHSFSAPRAFFFFAAHLLSPLFAVLSFGQIVV